MATGRIDSEVPWIEALSPPGEDVRVVHVGADPLFRRMPVRGYRTDLTIVADPVQTLEALMGRGVDVRLYAAPATIPSRSDSCCAARYPAACRPSACARSDD